MRKDDTMTAPTDALRALGPSYWEVEVRVSGESVLTIGSDHLAGISNIEDYADTVRKCGEHLRSFIGTPAGSASGGDDALDYQMAASAEAAEVDRRGKRIAELQAEVARLREDATRYRWLRDDPPVTLCVRQRHDEKRDLFYQYIDGSQLDAAIDAAMGSANGQG